MYDGKGLQVSAVAAVCVLSAEARLAALFIIRLNAKRFSQFQFFFKPLKKTNRGNKRLIYIKTGVTKNVQRKIN